MPIPRDPLYAGPLGLPASEVMEDGTKYHPDHVPDALWHEVRCIALSSPHLNGACNELEREDLVQEIMLSIYRRQWLRGCFDRRRASLGRYVYLVTSSVTANQLDKLWRQQKRETVARSQEWAIVARVEEG